MTETVDAVVVGSGPNGLAAAITLAQAGRSVTVLEAADQVGGGLRTDELTDGVRRDHCAAVFPFAVGSPYLRTLPLEAHGVEWLYPEVSYTHPLDDGRAGAAFPSLDDTLEALGADAKTYRRLVGPLVEQWDQLAAEALGPVLHLPRHLLTLARFGLTGLPSATLLGSRFDEEEARGLLAGCAAHGVLPLSRPLTGAFALLFASSAHAHGWPAVRGGAGVLAEAMADLLESLGGTIRTGHRVTSLDDIDPARAVLFDVDPAQLLGITGDELDDGYRKQLRRFRHGPGVFKVDHLLEGPVPWSDPWSAQAGTVHVGGTMTEVAAAEGAVADGTHPDRPFVLVAQPSVLDQARAPDGRHVLWSYCHVPSGSTIDQTSAIEAQIERFAPGFRDLIIDRWVTTPAQFEALNPNLVGGDITGGALDGFQLVKRPRFTRPYRTSNPRFFLCSASTPPGGGVHGMCGHLAAQDALATTLA